MAERTATLTYGDALSVATKQLSRGIQDDFGHLICNLSVNDIWMKYDWRESLAVLPPFYLIPNEQDHGAPAAAVPPDFFGLRWAEIVRQSTVPPMRQELQVIRDLKLTHIRYIPHAICYEPSKNCFRLFNRVPENIGNPEYMIEGKYKIRPTKITAANITTAFLPFDDTYFHVWVEMMKYHGMNILGDPRAGEVSYANGTFTYSGQCAKAHMALDAMAGTEGLELGDPVIAPNEPLVTNGPYRPNMFGIGFGF